VPESPNGDLAALRTAWPEWEIWVLHRHTGGTVWCAKRRDGDGPGLHAYEPVHLAEYMAEAAGGPS
jgi:hypothetical protein